MTPVRTWVVACVVACVSVLVFSSSGQAATRITEPTASPFPVLYDTGTTQQVTVKASGFKPNDQVTLVQCDGVPGTDVNWRPTVDCDTGTAVAAATADEKGDVIFPAGDVNFGLQIVKGPSPQRLFNCLAPGENDPKNGLKSYTTCQIRVTTDLVHRSPDQAFLSFQFKGNTSAASDSSSSSDSNTTVVVLVVVAAVVLVGGAIVLVMRRRRAH